MTDPIADFLTRIRNAVKANHKVVEAPGSKIKDVYKRQMEVRPERKISISMKNLVLYSRKRAGKTMADKLAAEIVDAYNQQGAAFKRKEEMHRMAEANKAFAHFRF